MSVRPAGISRENPPISIMFVVSRAPQNRSKTSRIISRSRKQYRLIDNAPMSSAWVPSQTRWLAMRLSSAMMTRQYWARSGAAIPQSFSTARM